MKIEKEVMLPASVDDIWPWLIDFDKLQKIWSSVSETETPKNRSKSANSQKECWNIISTKPQQKISFTTNRFGSSIVTAFELAARGKRTSLKVIISGWENVDSDKAKSEMPGISLEWERRLNLLKESIRVIVRDNTHTP